VPIPACMPVDELKELLNHMNGYLFPGGGAHMKTSGYYHHARAVFDHARKSKDQLNKPFPIWGTCLGFETLMAMQAGDDDSVLSKASATDISITLKFTDKALPSKLFRGASMDTMQNLQTLGMTYNHHVRCVTEDEFWQRGELHEFYDLLSTSKDVNGLTFVSTIEAKDYPIYATQWHPEKHSYEWANLKIDHSREAKDMSEYLVNFFVDECQKNPNVFPQELLNKYIIYNFNSTFSGKDPNNPKNHFQQIYLFN